MATTTTTKPGKAKAAPPPPPVAEKAPAPAARNSIAEWAVTIIVLLFGITFVAQPFVIPTSSMHNTLLTGDHLIVDKLAYSPAGSIASHFLPYTLPKRGDIIVFKHPTLLKEDYVKRVIGVPGDRIKEVNTVIYLNGKPLVEPYVVHLLGNFDPWRDNFPTAEPEFAGDPQMSARMLEMVHENVRNGELVVPEGSYFAMGDNRDNSLDSRYWGLVPLDNIEGKPFVIFWSYDAPTDDLKDYNFHHILDLGLHFFSKTRWDRTLKLVHGYPIQ
jgi:signal peptidase I